MFPAVTDATLNHILNSHAFVIIKCHAEWCTPCKALTPTLAKAVEDYQTTYSKSVPVFELNVEESPLSAGRYHVRGIPTLLAFRNGELVAQRNARWTKPEIIQWIRDTM